MAPDAACRTALRRGAALAVIFSPGGTSLDGPRSALAIFQSGRGSLLMVSLSGAFVSAAAGLMIAGQFGPVSGFASELAAIVLALAAGAATLALAASDA